MATRDPSPQRPLLRWAWCGPRGHPGLLAVQQYRWRVARIEASLNTSVSQFRQEFYRELLQGCSAFHREPGVEADDFWTGFAEGYQTWVRTAPRRTGSLMGGRRLAALLAQQRRTARVACD